MRYPKEVFSINELVTRENMRKYDEMMAKKYSNPLAIIYWTNENGMQPSKNVYSEEEMARWCKHLDKQIENGTCLGYIISYNWKKGESK